MSFTQIKRVVGMLLCFGMSLVANVSAQNNIDSLMHKRQYLSAYELLQFGGQNDSVEWALQKVDLALNYYLNSYYYRQFAFANLREGEVLRQLRQAHATAPTPYEFHIDSLLLQLQKQYPADHRLSKALGDFYNRIYYDFGDRWGMSAETLLEKSNGYYTEAFDNGVYDYYSLYAMGYYQSLYENYFAAQEWFRKSLELEPDAPLTNYSLAVTYLLDGIPKQGIEYAQRAFQLYTDSLEKADAARVNGILLLKAQQADKALGYFQMADSLHHNYRPTLMYLLVASLELKNDSLIIANGCKALQSNPYAPELPEELNSLFMKNNQEFLLHDIYNRVLDNNADDMEACGNIRFHYGKLLFKEGYRRKAHRMIKHSRRNFSDVFDESHQVFEAIEQTLEHMRSGR